MKTGIIDVGGGMRGIYAAGIFDRCLDESTQFDLCVGISAGSANIGAFLAGQRGRNYRFYTKYAFRKEYMSLRNYLRTGSYLDLDYIYGTLCREGGEDPLDYRHIMENPCEMLVIATDAVSGEAKYFDKSVMQQDQYDIFKASSAIPGVCKPYPIGGHLYFDGALSNTIPIEKAFQWGCDRVILILTKPKDVLRTPKKDLPLARMIRRKYPIAAQNFCGRAARYNKAVAKAREYERQGKILILAPDDTCGVDTLTRNKDDMHRLYLKGYQDAAAIRSFLRD